jgi:hypothetical protein
MSKKYIAKSSDSVYNYIVRDGVLPCPTMRSASGRSVGLSGAVGRKGEE